MAIAEKKLEEGAFEEVRERLRMASELGVNTSTMEGRLESKVRSIEAAEAETKARSDLEKGYFLTAEIWAETAQAKGAQVERLIAEIAQRKSDAMRSFLADAIRLVKIGREDEADEEASKAEQLGADISPFKEAKAIAEWKRHGKRMNSEQVANFIKRHGSFAPEESHTAIKRLEEKEERERKASAKRICVGAKLQRGFLNTCRAMDSLDRAFTGARPSPSSGDAFCRCIGSGLGEKGWALVRSFAEDENCSIHYQAIAKIMDWDWVVVSCGHLR